MELRISHILTNICDIIPEEYKKLNNLNRVKESIKKWVPHNYRCKLCKLSL